MRSLVLIVISLKTWPVREAQRETIGPKWGKRINEGLEMGGNGMKNARNAYLGDTQEL